MKKRSVLPVMVVTLAAAVAVFPVLFILSNSLMSGREILSHYGSAVTAANQNDFIYNDAHFVHFTLLPSNPTLAQYKTLLFYSPVYLRMFWNSLILVVPVLVGQMVLAPLTAYGFEYVNWKWKEALYFLYIVILLMPTQLLMVPNFLVAGWLHIRDSYLAIILPALFHPLGVFLVRQQLKGFPRACMEAAALDGATAMQAYRCIVRPNMHSAVAAMLVLLFADNWNIVDQAVVFIHETFDDPLSVYLGTVAEADPGIFFAVSVFYFVPALVVFLLGEESLSEGIVLSEMK